MRHVRPRLDARRLPGRRKITFWEFTEYGLIVTVISVALAMPYLWLRFFVL